MNFTSKIRRNRPLLGTFVEITAFVTPDLSEDQVEDIVKSAYQNIERLEAILSKQNPSSALSKLNSCGYLEKAAPELLSVIKISNTVSKITDGLFDITAESGLSGCYKNIQIRQNSINFTQDLKIDLGGIAKGYIVDSTAIFLAKHRIKNNIINAGGDIRISGDISYPVHLRNPFDSKQFLELGNFSNCAVASSSITLESKNRGGKSQVTKHKNISDKNDSNLVHATTIASYKNYPCTIADALTKPLLLGCNLSKLKRIDYILADQNMNFLTNK